MKYSTTAHNMTPLKPMSIASNTASIALSTEAQPFMPQAQGIKCGLVCCNVARPIGNGMPITNASGAARTKADVIRAISGNDIIVLLISGSSTI